MGEFQLEKKDGEFLLSETAVQFLQRLEGQVERDYQTACTTTEAPKRVAFHICYSLSVNMECLNIREDQREKVKDALLSLEEKVWQDLSSKNWTKSDWSQLKRKEG